MHDKNVFTLALSGATSASCASQILDNCVDGFVIPLRHDGSSFARDDSRHSVIQILQKGFRGFKNCGEHESRALGGESAGLDQ